MNLQDSHDWLLWQARNAVGEPHFKTVVVVETLPPPIKAKRKKHWAGSFQIKFSHWLSGDGERPCNLGYTRRMLARHLERQFSKGMNWANYAGNMPFKSNRVWVVDHIVPKCLFGTDEVVEAYALSNLRPFWQKDNMIKGSTRSHLL